MALLTLEAGYMALLTQERLHGFVDPRRKSDCMALLTLEGGCMALLTLEGGCMASLTLKGGCMLHSQLSYSVTIQSNPCTLTINISNAFKDIILK